MMPMLLLRENFATCFLIYVIFSVAVFASDLDASAGAYLTLWYLPMPMMLYSVDHHLRQSFLFKVGMLHSAAYQTESDAHHALRAAAQKVEEQRAKTFSTVVDGMAHDLRTPMSALHSGCKVLENLLRKPEAAGMEPPFDGPLDASNTNLTTMLKVLTGMSAASQVRPRMLCVSLSDACCGKVGVLFVESMSISSNLLHGNQPPISITKVNLKTFIDRHPPPANPAPPCPPQASLPLTPWWWVGYSTIACARLAYPSSKKVNITTDIGANVMEEVYSDALCLTRNLLTFMCNACNHTADGSISVHCDVVKERSEEGSQEEPFLEFTVRDTGSGVRQVSNGSGDLWDPFMSSPVASSGAGLGLGLFVVSRQCEAMNGTCGMRENPDRVGEKST